MIKNRKILLTILIIIVCILLFLVLIINTSEEDKYVGKWKDDKSVGTYIITKNKNHYKMQTDYKIYENGIVEDGLLKFKSKTGRIYAYKYKDKKLICYYYKNHQNGEKSLEQYGYMERIE